MLKRKKLLLAVARERGIDVTGFKASLPIMGPAARRVLADFQRSVGLSPTGRWNSETLAWLRSLAEPKYVIRTDYHAAKHGGTRSLAVVKYVVIHDGELWLDGGTVDAEAMGRYFASGSVTASPHFGVDNNSIQQYLGLNIVGWHCTNFNTTTVGIEQGGRASWTRQQWLANADAQIDRVAWLVAYLCKKLSLPVVYRDAAYLKAHGVNPAKSGGGITTHLAHTRALQPGDHTDPGPNYPMDVLIAAATKYRSAM